MTATKQRRKEREAFVLYHATDLRHFVYLGSGCSDAFRAWINAFARPALGYSPTTGTRDISVWLRNDFKRLKL